MNNDKTLVIIGVTILAVLALFILGAGGKEIVTNAISGLLGLAIGQSLRSV